MSDIGMPGPNGSLGQCAICGGNFMVEIILGDSAISFRVNGCDQTLYGHRKCLEPYRDGKEFEWSTLPEQSPLRKAWTEALEAAQ